MKVIDIAFFFCVAHAIEANDEGHDRHGDPEFQDNVHFLNHLYRYNILIETV